MSVETLLERRNVSKINAAQVWITKKGTSFEEISSGLRNVSAEMNLSISQNENWFSFCSTSFCRNIVDETK